MVLFFSSIPAHHRSSLLLPHPPSVLYPFFPLSLIPLFFFSPTLSGVVYNVPITVDTQISVVPVLRTPTQDMPLFLDTVFFLVFYSGSSPFFLSSNLLHSLLPLLTPTSCLMWCGLVVFCFLVWVLLVLLWFGLFSSLFLLFSYPIHPVSLTPSLTPLLNFLIKANLSVLVLVKVMRNSTYKVGWEE